MEHVPLPASHDPVLTSTLLEYVGEVYENHSFDTYPEKRGFDLVNNIFRGEQRDKLVAMKFYQTWIYPGLLQTVLDVYDPSPFIKTIDGVKYVTTAKLQETVENHSKKVFSWSTEERLSWIERVGRSIKVASVAFHELDVANDRKRVWIEHDPLTARVQLSLALLGEALMSYLFWVVRTEQKANTDYKPPDIAFPRWRSGPLPEWICKEKGWCLSEQHRNKWTQPSVKVFLASMNLPRDKEAHRNCSEKACIADTIDESVYKTKHVTEFCDCEFLGPDVDSVMACLEQGKIPVLNIHVVDEHISEITCEPLALREMDDEDHEGEDDFVSLSHVWSDGLGNAQENKLPRCQLLRIAKLAQSVPELEPEEIPFKALSTKKQLSIMFGRDKKKKQKAQREKPKYGTVSRIWIDTLCVPREPAHRKLAIHTMDRVYQQAKCILVLDRQLQQFPYTTDEDAMCRVSMSGWIRRVWTFQEAILACLRVVFQFADQSVSEMTIQKRLNDRIHSDEKGLHTLRHFAVTLEDDGFFRLRNWWRELDYRPAYFNTKVERTFLGAIRTGKKLFHYDFVERFQILPLLWESMERRSTTKEEDRAIIASTLLKLDTAKLLSAPREERIQNLMKLLVEVPAYVIFAESPRLQQEPFRWAPCVFREGGWGKGIAKVDVTHAAQVTDKGLSLKFDGFLFKGELPRKASFWTIVDKVAYSIVLVRPDDADHELGEGEWYEILNRSSNGLAIIVTDMAPYTFETLDDEGKVNSYNVKYGTLVSIQEEKKKMMVVRFEALARVGEITSIDPELAKGNKGLGEQMCQGTSFVQDQQWLVM